MILKFSQAQEKKIDITSEKNIEYFNQIKKLNGILFMEKNKKKFTENIDNYKKQLEELLNKQDNDDYLLTTIITIAFYFLFIFLYLNYQEYQYNGLLNFRLHLYKHFLQVKQHANNLIFH